MTRFFYTIFLLIHSPLSWANAAATHHERLDTLSVAVDEYIENQGKNLLVDAGHPWPEYYMTRNCQVVDLLNSSCEVVESGETLIQSAVHELFWQTTTRLEISYTIDGVDSNNIIDELFGLKLTGEPNLFGLAKVNLGSPQTLDLGIGTNFNERDPVSNKPLLSVKVFSQLANPSILATGHVAKIHTLKIDRDPSLLIDEIEEVRGDTEELFFESIKDYFDTSRIIDSTESSSASYQTLFDAHQNKISEGKGAWAPAGSKPLVGYPDNVIINPLTNEAAKGVCGMPYTGHTTFHCNTLRSFMELLCVPSTKGSDIKEEWWIVLPEEPLYRETDVVCRGSQDIKFELKAVNKERIEFLKGLVSEDSEQIGLFQRIDQLMMSLNPSFVSQAQRLDALIDVYLGMYRIYQEVKKHERSEGVIVKTAQDLNTVVAQARDGLEIKDPFGNDYSYERINDSNGDMIILRSAGPDGLFSQSGESDDITSINGVPLGL